MLLSTFRMYLRVENLGNRRENERGRLSLNEQHGPSIVTKKEILLHTLSSSSAHIEVIIDINTCQKLGDGIFVRILLLLNDLNEILKLRPPSFVYYESSGKIWQKMRSICWNSIQIPIRNGSYSIQDRYRQCKQSA